MNNEDWQLTTPIDAVIFDCDGTLSHLEGINELAKKSGVGEQVQKLTEMAMNEVGITANLYHDRMSLVKPDRVAIEQLGTHYYESRVLYVHEVIEILQSLGKQVYIVSAGLNPAVALLGAKLGVPEKHIFAVDAYFDEQNNYSGYDKSSPLTSKGGKRLIVANIRAESPHLLHIGDGMNDFEAHDLVDRFVGYGGAFYRENIAKLCRFYIKSESMLPLLPLCLTQDEVGKMNSNNVGLYQQGLELLMDSGVLFNKQVGN